MSDFADSTASTWKRFSAFAVRVFHDYASWLVSISWWRFAVLSLLLLILTSIVQKLPPFRWSQTETIEALPTASIPPVPPAPPVPATPPGMPKVKIDGDGIRVEAPGNGKNEDVTISIDKNGVRIGPRRAEAAASAASSASIAASSAAAAASKADAAASAADESIQITLPDSTRETIREAIKAARDAAREAAQEARDEAEQARQDAEEARRDAQEAIADARQYKRTRIVHFGDSFDDLAFFFILASAVLKATYKGRLQAEVKAAAATETAESEQLKRQVVEARMAAMQAQVEPHFLFNTLASI
ncbi:MAG: histidine kinase, partial [Burkholderiales bacterium]